MQRSSDAFSHNDPARSMAGLNLNYCFDYQHSARYNRRLAELIIISMAPPQSQPNHPFVAGHHDSVLAMWPEVTSVDEWLRWSVPRRVERGSRLSNAITVGDAPIAERWSESQAGCWPLTHLTIDRRDSTPPW